MPLPFYRPSKLLIVGPKPPPFYGMSVATDLLLKVLNAGEARVLLVDTADRRSFISQGRFDRTNVVLALRHGVEFSWKLLRHRPDVVYVPIAQNVPGFLRDLTFLVPARLVRAKVVVHLHGASFGQFYASTPPWFARLVRWSLADVAAAVVLGPGGEKLFSGIIPPDRVTVIPNGLPDDVTCREGREGADDEAEGPRLLFLSTLMREKGFLDVLRAMPEVLRLVPNARLTLAGDWFSNGDREEALRFLVDADLERSVVLLGPVGPSEKRALLSQSDVFVMPPRHIEGMPYVILEAMRAGLPVVSTPVGFIPWMVDDGRTGLLVSPDDSESLCRALVALLRDRPLREALGRAGREKFLNEFTLERWAEAMNRVLLGETAFPQRHAR